MPEPTDDLAFSDADSYEELTGEALNAEVDAEMEAGEANRSQEQELPQWAVDRKVTVYGHEFIVEPPTVGITLRIINCFGILGVRGERVVMRALRSLAQGSQQGVSISGRAALFGMLAALNLEDVYALGSAVLQFPDDRKGKVFLRDAPEGQAIPLSPLIRALFLNLAQSTDLRDALIDFFDGVGMMENLLDGLNLNL